MAMNRCFALRELAHIPLKASVGMLQCLSPRLGVLAYIAREYRNRMNVELYASATLRRRLVEAYE